MSPINGNYSPTMGSNLVNNQVHGQARQFRFLDQDPIIASTDLMEYVFTHIVMMSQEEYQKLHSWMIFQGIWSLDSLLDIYMDMPWQPVNLCFLADGIVDNIDEEIFSTVLVVCKYHQEQAVKLQRFMDYVDWLKLSKRGFSQYRQSSYNPTWFPQIVYDKNVYGSDQISDDNELTPCEDAELDSSVFDEATYKAGNLSPYPSQGSKMIWMKYNPICCLMHMRLM